MVRMKLTMVETKKGILILALLLTQVSIEVSGSDPDSFQCHEKEPNCTCSWIDGKQTANCPNGTWPGLPLWLSPSIESLVMEGNRVIIRLTDVDLSLIGNNLQNVTIRNCSLRELEKGAFKYVNKLIEIDFSNNRITKLEPSLFATTKKLRRVNFSGNAIERLEDGLFVNLTQLQVVDLENNRISYIGPKAFDNIPQLKIIKLNGNKLSVLEKNIFYQFGSTLESLELKNNPWKCDCQLRDFIAWYSSKKFVDPILCSESELSANTFSKCNQSEQLLNKPDILRLRVSLDTSFESNTDQLTLACKVLGNPKPEAYWAINSTPILGNQTGTELTSSDGKDMNFQNEQNVFWVNTTISKINHQDQGIYSCVAKNSAGVVERNVTILV